MSEEPTGIPGHVGKSEWSKRLQEWLRDCGLRYEAEGEATRIMVDGVLVQVAEGEEGGYSVIVSAPLPSRGASDAEVADACNALRLAARIAGEEGIKYEIDDSLPSYPMLYIIIGFSDPWSLAQAIVDALSDMCRGEQG